MAVKKFNTRIQLKRDSASAFSGFTPLAGELLVVTDNHNVKIGDGTTVFGSLPWLVGGATIAGYDAAPNGVTLTNPIANTDTLDIALAKLQNQVSSAAAGGVLSIASQSGNIAIGNGLSMTVSGTSPNETKTLDAQVNPNGYLTVSSTSGSEGLDINPAKVDADYHTGGTVHTSTNIATVGTVSSAIGTLDVAEYAQGSIDTTTTSGQTTFTVKGIKETDGKIDASSASADTSLVIDGTYNASSNKIATKSTVTAAIEALDVTGFTQAEIDTATEGQTKFTINGIQESDGQIMSDGGHNIDLYFDGEYNSSTNRIATQSTVTAAVNAALDSEVTFKGVTATLPNSPTNGDMWKASTDIAIPAASAGEGSAVTAEAGDTIIYKNITGATGNGWYIIPSGDESFTDTWRNVTVNGGAFLGSGISTGAINFAQASSNPVTVSGASGTVTIQHTSYTIPGATDTQKSEGQSVTAVSGIVGDGYGHISSFTTSTFTIPTVNNATLTIAGASGGPISVAGSKTGGAATFSANDDTANTITITHTGKPTSLTPAAVKVAVDDFGHAQTGDPLAASDISATTGTYGGSSDVSTVQGALTNLATGLGSHTHSIADLTQAAGTTSGGITNTDELVIFDCGSATVNTNNVSNS